MKEITLDFIDRMCRDYENDPTASAMTDSVSKNGSLIPSLRFDIQKSLPFVFETDVWDGGVTDQGSTGRCWAFASLNIVRHHMRDTLHIADKNFELSQNYAYFFDQLEKCSGFMDRIIASAELPLDDKKVQNMLRRPIMDNGMWNMFIKLSEKYGVVPKYMMPDTQCSSDSRYVTRLLEQKLKYAAMCLRRAHEEGRDMYEEKERQMAGAFSILTRFLGVPPREITFEYRTADGSYARLDTMTPVEFFKRYGGMASKDYMLIMNRPNDRFPFGKTYVTDEDWQQPDKYLNLEMDRIKEMTIAQLKGGEQVIMGCDVAKQSHKPSGYMHASLLNYEQVFGTELEFPDRRTWLAYKGDVGATSGGHIMTFDGVQLDENGRPLRWKVQNSYGPSMGIKGHYVMDDSWFDRYLSSVVIERKYAPQDVLDAYDALPEVIDHSELF